MQEENKTGKLNLFSKDFCLGIWGVGAYNIAYGLFMKSDDLLANGVGLVVVGLAILPLLRYLLSKRNSDT